jgi:hypothetical protein
MGLPDGGPVTLLLEDGSLRVMSVKEGIRRAQALVAKFGQPERVLSEELIADRRREAALE